MQTLFRQEVERFRDWAATYPLESRSGEWECDYDHWRDLWRAFHSYITSNAPSSSNDETISDVIYAIARDNEMEELVLDLSKTQAWFLFVLPAVLICNEADARWQFAKAIGGQILPFDVAEHALLQLVVDQNEYVSRMALRALGQIGSNFTELYCERAWATNQEYQRIMVLWALKAKGSSRLPEYVLLAKEDGRE